MTNTPSTQPQGPIAAFQTTSGKSITVEQTYDHQAHGGGRGWQVGIQESPDKRPESVASITIGPKGFGSTTPVAEINWSAWGAQPVATARDFAEAMVFAADFAHDDLIVYMEDDEDGDES